MTRATRLRWLAALLACGAAALAQPPAPPARTADQPAAPADALKNSVTIEVKDGYRVITSNGIPDHTPGKFPNRGNPNSIREQHYALRVPEKPTPAEKAVPVERGLFGVSLNGVVFDPGTAEYWKDDRSTGWRMEAIRPRGVAGRNLGLDEHNAHVQPDGSYHYHATPFGLVENLEKAKGVKHGEAMILVGWAADGYPIYDHHGYTNPADPKSELKELRSSYRLKKGERPGADAKPTGPGGAFDGVYTQDWEYIAASGDLDECNGRTGITPEFPAGTYYYVITTEFPYVPRAYHGNPDRSFQRRPPSGGGPPGRGPGRRPPGGGPPPSR